LEDLTLAFRQLLAYRPLEPFQGLAMLEGSQGERPRVGQRLPDPLVGFDPPLALRAGRPRRR